MVGNEHLAELRNNVAFLREIPDEIYFRLDSRELYFPDPHINQVRITLERLLGHHVMTYRKNIFHSELPCYQHLCANLKTATLDQSQLTLLAKYENLFKNQGINFIVYQRPMELIKVERSTIYYYGTALEVRRQFEARTVEESLLCDLYQQYQKVGDCSAFIKRALDLFPKLNCGLASVYLKYLLQGGTIIRGNYKGHKHTFLEFDDEIIVDITADQYNGPKVYAGLRKEPWQSSSLVVE